MALVSPDKFIRKAYIEAFQNAAIPANVWADIVPITDGDNPYILLTTQTKQRTAVSKNGWEWNTQITVDICYISPKGFSESNKVDDLEGAVIEAIENGIQVDNFAVKSTNLVTSQPLRTETDSNTIWRRILIYEHWVCQV